MRRTGFIIAVGLVAATRVSPAFAAGDHPASSPPIFCGNGIPGGVNCIASKKELKEARYAFDRGVKLKDHRRLEEAFTQFDTATDRKSTRLNSSHANISYAVFCLKK